jgi:hypothetical protein
MLATQARCVILDPNADFRRISETVPKNRWQAAHYDRAKRQGLLPHEESVHQFSAVWKNVTKELRGGPALPRQAGEPLRLEWHSLSMEVLADDLVPMLHNELYHCHEFTKAVGRIVTLRDSARMWARRALALSGQGVPPEPSSTRASQDAIDTASQTLRRLRGITSQEKREDLKDRFAQEQIIRPPWLSFPDASPDITGTDLMRLLIDRAIVASEYISPEVARYYFGKAREYIAQQIVQAEVWAGTNQPWHPRLEITDLPSFPNKKTRYLALNSVLTTVWEQARREWASEIAKSDGVDERVPTFVVIDEAHNLIPRETQDLAALALREQLRSIAAEGRKYGLFLVLCTQRPDKIDTFVLSECENRAVMRIGSQSVLKETKTLMGLEDVPWETLSRCLEFGTGRALLVGPWAMEASTQGVQLYSAMRRTAEGGGNLRAEHWAVPTRKEEPPPAASPEGEPA